MLFRKIITVYSKNHSKPVNTLWGLNAEFLNTAVNATYTYSYAVNA
jgi:hypothetical protein